jgi:hypothetical protein
MVFSLFIHPESGEVMIANDHLLVPIGLAIQKADNPELWKKASPLTYAGKIRHLLYLSIAG